jgi:hypothetical protein
MSATIEERLARYTARLDQAATDYSARSATNPPLTTPEHNLGRGPGRGSGRQLVAAAVVACVVAVAGFAIASRRSNQNVKVSTVTSVTIAPATTPPPDVSTAPTSTTPTSSTAPSTVQTVPVGTAQVTYQPFSGNAVDPRLHVTQHLSGTCVSPASGLRNGYRCFADGGTILDPCFADSHGTADPLVCPNDPVGPDVVELTARSNTANPPGGVTNPWEIQLSTGQLCRLVSAAWGTGGPYSCAKPGVAQPVADCHVPVPAQPWWTAECQEQLTDASPFAASRVVKVWY